MIATKILAAASLLGLTLSPAIAETYAPDPGHTIVRASYTHAGFSEQSINFRGVSGTVDYTPGDISSVSVDMTIDLSKIETALNFLTDDLKSENFFEIAKWPTANFVSTGVEKTSDTTAKITGDLTVKDITAPVTLEVTLKAAGKHPVGQFFDYYKGEWIGVTATATISRSAFGLGHFGPIASDDVQLFISSELKAQ